MYVCMRGSLRDCLLFVTEFQAALHECVWYMNYLLGSRLCYVIVGSLLLLLLLLLDGFALVSVSLPTSLVVISNYAFGVCKALTTIVIPT